MARPTVNLEPHKDFILELWSQSSTKEAIAEAVSVRSGEPVSDKTIARRLELWKAPKKRIRMTPNQREDLLLKARLHILYFYEFSTDTEMLKQLQAEGYAVGSLSVIRRLRAQYGLYRRTAPARYDQAIANTHQIVKEALQNSPEMGNLGRQRLFTELRRSGFNITRDSMFAALKKIDPEGIERRRTKHKTKEHITTENEDPTGPGWKESTP